LATLDPSFHAALFTVERRFPFIAGDLIAPTLSRSADRVAFAHAPLRAPNDPWFDRVVDALGRGSPQSVDLRARQVLVVDNHRVLHGRTPFDDTGRELIRYLAWMSSGRPVPAVIRQRASLPLRRARSFPTESPSSTELTWVARMLDGESPGAIARKERILEERLYRLRDSHWRQALRLCRDHSR
jgi:gamma-butyrobetaine dioxygenase